MVVGISVNPDVFITRNVIIDLDASSLLFNSCNDFIAFNPIGVAALPTPNIFTIMLLDIYPIALWLFGISLNNGFIIFDVIFDNLSISPDFSAIFIIPSHSARLGNIWSTKFNASLGYDRIVSVILFPVIIENVIPINIKLNHIIFTIC